jgi:hypothetical protein
MKRLKIKGYCNDEDIKGMEELNKHFEKEQIKTETIDSLQLVEDYRKTMQPMVEPDDDDLYTNKRLQFSLWY